MQHAPLTQLKPVSVGEVQHEGRTELIGQEARHLGTGAAGVGATGHTTTRHTNTGTTGVYTHGHCPWF